MLVSLLATLSLCRSATRNTMRWCGALCSQDLLWAIYGAICSCPSAWKLDINYSLHCHRKQYHSAVSYLHVVVMFCHLLLLFPVFHFVWTAEFIFCKSGIRSQTSCTYMSHNEHVNYILIAFLYKNKNLCLFGQMFISCITYDQKFS